jgi:hypothetical protein
LICIQLLLKATQAKLCIWKELHVCKIKLKNGPINNIYCAGIPQIWLCIGNWNVGAIKGCDKKFFIIKSRPGKDEEEEEWKLTGIFDNAVLINLLAMNSIRYHRI